MSAFAKKPKTQTAEVGATVVFEAEAEKPDAKVRWQKDAKDLATSDKYDIKADSGKHSLTIKDVAKEDAAGYCVIAGGSKVKFELKLKEPEGGLGFETVALTSLFSKPAVVSLCGMLTDILANNVTSERLHFTGCDDSSTFGMFNKPQFTTI